MPAPLGFTITTDHLNQRLDNFLLTRLKGLPKSCLYRLLRQGKIRVNKKRKQPSYRLQVEDSIKLPALSLNTPATPPKPTLSLQQLLQKSILFENKNLLIINKPQGLAVHGGSNIQLGLIESLRQLYPPSIHLELAHRLDRETSGCLLIAKKPSILKELHQLFREGKIKKHYLLLVKGHWPAELKKISVPLKKNQLKSGERMVTVHPEGKSTLTQFRVHQHLPETTWVEAILHTGRTHQIRVHTAHVKHPIIGDEKYGDKLINKLFREKGYKHLCLHAHQLKFTLASTGETIQVEAPLPASLGKMI